MIIFKYKNELQTVRPEKVEEKNGVIYLISMFPSWVMVRKLSKKVHFLQFCADLSKKSKSIKAIYIYASERSRYALSENGIVYYAMTYYFEYISVWSRRILLNFCWVSIFFDILISNISSTDPYKPYYFLKECKGNSQMHICKLLEQT